MAGCYTIDTHPQEHPDAIDFERRFGGIARLYGKSALERFRTAHVCVVGVGGVGSWIVEALARTAIGKLTLIDLDNVAESNINRQIQALSSTIGQAKIDALRAVSTPLIRTVRSHWWKISSSRTIWAS